MIPQDAPAQDWAMYYHDTYMTHIDRGPCKVSVHWDDEHEEKVLFAATIQSSGRLNDPKVVDPQELRILWPRPGAYNFPKMGGAGFIGRQPQRHMKRSAYRDHYYIQWSPVSIPSQYMMNMIAVNCNYWSVDAFLKEQAKAKSGRRTSAAISPKIILFQEKPDSAVSVIYLSEDIGHLVDGKLKPHMEHDSRLPRIMRHLATIGIT